MTAYYISATMVDLRTTLYERQENTTGVAVRAVNKVQDSRTRESYSRREGTVEFSNVNEPRNLGQIAQNLRLMRRISHNISTEHTAINVLLQTINGNRHRSFEESRRRPTAQRHRE